MGENRPKVPRASIAAAIVVFTLMLAILQLSGKFGRFSQASVENLLDMSASIVIISDMLS